MTLDEFNAKLASRYKVVQGKRSPWCETGDEYVTLAVGGPKPEGESVGMLAIGERVAVSGLWDAFEKYAAGKRGTVYIRRNPQTEVAAVMMQHPSIETVPLYVATVRLVISDKPVISEAA